MPPSHSSPRFLVANPWMARSHGVKWVRDKKHTPFSTHRNIRHHSTDGCCHHAQLRARVWQLDPPSRGRANQRLQWLKLNSAGRSNAVLHTVVSANNVSERTGAHIKAPKKPLCGFCNIIPHWLRLAQQCSEANDSVITYCFL